MKKLLVLNFFPAFFPPSSGGEQRYFYLYQYLSREYDVTLLSPTHQQSRNELIEHTSSFREHRIPKEEVHINLHGRLHQENVGSEVSGLVCGLAAGVERGFRRAYRQHAKEADIIIHECPHMFDYDEYVGVDRKPRVYNSYNVEFVLATDIFNKVSGDSYATYIYDLERRVIEASAKVFATCAPESETFQQWYDCPAEKLAIVPNGFEPSPSDALISRPANWSVPKPFVLFMGSAHPPNVQAAQFILHTLAPSLPEVSFVFIGSVCKALRPESSNVELLGLVDEGTKAWLLQECSAALNPMFTGAGTNLKITDYMSHGAPVLTTPFGVRGISVVDGEHCYVASLERFSDTLRKVLSSTSESRSVGAAGRELVFAQYTWENIAKKTAETLASIQPEQPRKKHPVKPRVLLANDFPADHPRGGGEVRIHHLYRELARHFEVTILCLSGETSRRETILGPGIRQIAIPKTPRHVEVENEVERLSGTSARDIISLLYCAENADLTSEFRNRVQINDVVIFCHPYLASLASLVPSRVPIVYEALNHESSLKRGMLANHPLAADLIAAVEAGETHLVQRASQVVCVSTEDGERFSAMAPGKPMLLVRNGVLLPAESEPIRSDKSLDERSRALFVGSAHPPNVESLRFLVSEVAPSVPEVDFLIVGSVCDTVDKNSLPSNVTLYGFLDDDHKASLMRKVHIGLNPMFSGSGSNLKVADYFAAGLAVVSTPFGIRGFDVIDGVHVRVAIPQQFATAIRSLHSDPQLRRRMGTAAWQYATSSLSWQTLAGKYGSALKHLLPAQKRTKRSLLAITYRYTDVPQGGAEVYFAELLKQINVLDEFDIDIATIDVQQIDNRLHFSALYKGAESNRTAPPFARNLFVFPLDMPAEVEIRNGVEQLFTLWQQESIEHARTCLDYYDQSLLMGGWHFTEQQRDGRTLRWTSGFSEIFCVDGTTALELDGYSLSEKNVRVSFRAHQLLATRVRGEFTWKLELPSHRGGVLRIFCEPERIPEDPRSLGLQIRAIRETIAGKQKDLPLQEDYEACMRARHAAAWVDSLIRIAEARSREKDEIFCRVRGPHSLQLNHFLLQHSREYDVALIQGIPFSITPEALRCTKEVGLPTVLLPHVHMEDRYYHWRTFNDAFRAADLVLGAPEEVKPLFFAHLGAKCALVPGGGVQPEEFQSLAACKKSFKAVYPSNVPFVLVLGRKTGAKNYKSVITAVEMLRQRGHELNVVLIGPDEDGAPIDKPFVFNFGRQPREVVIGALASSLTLVNMSESESFGIVLLESWMCERPVVANRTCSAFAQLIDHGRDGFLCGNVQELADVVALLSADPERAAKMGANGHVKALQSFTWLAIGREVNNLLLDLTQDTASAVGAPASENTGGTFQMRSSSVVEHL